MTSKIVLTTRKPLVRALGLGGRVKREMPQPLYVVRGKLVAHIKRKLREVTIIDPTTVSVDLLAPAFAEIDASAYKRLEVGKAITDMGGKPFALTPAAAKPAKAAPAKAVAAPAAKAAKAVKGAVAKAGTDLQAVIAAIMASDAKDGDKVAAIKALMA